MRVWVCTGYGFAVRCVCGGGGLDDEWECGGEGAVSMRRKRRCVVLGAMCMSGVLVVGCGEDGLGRVGRRVSEREGWCVGRMAVCVV